MKKSTIKWIIFWIMLFGSMAVALYISVLTTLPH